MFCVVCTVQAGRYDDVNRLYPPEAQRAQLEASKALFRIVKGVDRCLVKAGLDVQCEAQ